MNPLLAYSIFRLNLREFQSRRLLLWPFVLVVVVILVPHFIRSMALGKGGYYRLTNEVCMNLIGYAGLALALYLGSTTYRQDVENRTLHTLIAHPISLLNYHLGKFLAAIALLLTSHIVTSGLHMAIFAATVGCPPDYQIVWTGYCLGLGSCVVFSFCYACSTRCSPALAGVAGGAMYIIGSLSSHLLEYFTLQDRGDYHVYALAESIRALLPKILVFDTTLCSTHLIRIPDDYVMCCGLYSFLWTLFLLLISVALTTRTDL